MKIISTLIVSAFTLALCLFLNGNINVGSYMPPFGKILFPKTGLWQNAELYTKDFTIKSELVSGEVTVVFDDRMVAHIYADNISDALFAQGYIQARDRLFQMDLSTRSAGGTLSEVVGEVALKHDIKMRKEGMRYNAEKTVKEWKKTKNDGLLNSYCAGINTYIDKLHKKSYPFEFKLLNYKPQKWSPLKSALIQKQMERMLCGAEEDIQLTNLRATLGDTLFNQLYPHRNPYDEPIIPDEENYDFEIDLDEFDPSYNMIDSFTHQIKFKSNKGIGSNNWAISSEKSKTGKPILSNDPHLKLSLPSIWHEIHIHTPKINARGVGIPGIPGILVGFNKNVAWGTTNVGQDVKDYYKIKYLDQEKSRYEIDGKSKNIDVRLEDIEIRNGVDTTIQVRETIWGPIVFESNDGKKDLAMSWLPYHRTEHEDFLIFVDILDAKNYFEFEEKMNNYQTPAQNFAAVSNDGNIGLRVTGLFAAKQEGDGKFVKDGSISKAGNEKYIPTEHLAKSVNPERGFVASANQFSTAENYPYSYSSVYFENYRGRRITNLLEEGQNLGVDDMKELQADVFNIKSSEIVPVFLEWIETLELNNTQKKYKSLLENWDYRFTAESIAPTIFTAWYRAYRNLTFDEIHNLSKRMTVSFPDPWLLYDLSITNPTHQIFDIENTIEVELAKDIAIQAFQDISGSDEYLVKWSSFRNITIPHLAQIDGLGSDVLNIGGNGDVLNAITKRFSPSWRMIVAVGDEPEAYGVFPGGQSGNPNSEYYKNSIDEWAEGKYHKLELLDLDEIQNPLLNINFKSK